jgi:hypothetical protein
MRNTEAEGPRDARAGGVREAPKGTGYQTIFEQIV